MPRPRDERVQASMEETYRVAYETDIACLCNPGRARVSGLVARHERVANSFAGSCQIHVMAALFAADYSSTHRMAKCSTSTWAATAW